MTFIVLKLKKINSLNKKELFWLSDIGLEYVLLDKHFVALSDTSGSVKKPLHYVRRVSFNKISRQVSLNTEFFKISCVFL